MFVMKPSHFLALRAASRVAFSTAIVACGGGVAGSSSDDLPTDTSPSSPRASLPPTPPSHTTPPPPPAEVDASVVVADASVPNECKSASDEEACCLALERAERASRTDAGVWPELASANAIACCDVTLIANRADGGAKGADWNDTWACCTVIPDSYSKYPESCMAWGPPVPPSIAWKRTERLALAA
jgi:hypothetical protein